jgi:hypothetical protein
MFDYPQYVRRPKANRAPDSYRLKFFTLDEATDRPGRHTKQRGRFFEQGGQGAATSSGRARCRDASLEWLDGSSESPELPEAFSDPAGEHRYHSAIEHSITRQEADHYEK